MCVSRSLWLDSSLFSSVCPLKTTPAILYHCILSNSSNDSKTTWLNVIFPFFFYSIMQMYYNAKLTNAAANLLEQVNLNFLNVITAFSTISWHILFSCFRCNRSVAGKINKILVLIAFCLSVCLQLYRVSLKKNRWKRSLRRRKREWLNVVKRSHVRGSCKAVQLLIERCMFWHGKWSQDTALYIHSARVASLSAWSLVYYFKASCLSLVFVCLSVCWILAFSRM